MKIMKHVLLAILFMTKNFQNKISLMPQNWSKKIS